MVHESGQKRNIPMSELFLVNVKFLLSSFLEGLYSSVYSTFSTVTNSLSQLNSPPRQKKRRKSFKNFSGNIFVL